MKILNDKFHFFLYITSKLFFQNILLSTPIFLLIPEKGHGFKECLDNIFYNNFSNETFIVAYNVSENFNVQFEILKTTNTSGKIDVYVLKLANVKKAIHFLMNSYLINAKSSFIVWENNSTEDIFHTFFQYYIYNVILIDNNKLYTYFPFKYENLNHPHLEKEYICECTDLRRNKIKIFPNKIPSTWRNSTVRVSIIFSAPYVMCIKCEENKGTELSMQSIIEEVLKFRVEYNDNFRTWGRMLENGSFTDSYGGIQKGLVDYGLGCFHLARNEHLYFDVSVNFWQDYLIWVVPSARSLPLWMNIFLIFTFETWVWLILIFLLTSIVLYYIGKHMINTDLNKKFRTLIDCTFFLFFHNDGYIEASWKVKFILVHFSFFSLVLVSIFSSKLFAFSTENLYEHQIATLEDIKEAGLKIGLHPDIIENYEPVTEAEKYIKQHAVPCDTSMFCLNMVAKGKMANAKPQTLLRFLITKYYLDSEGQPLIFQMKFYARSEFYYWFFRKGFPAAHQISRIISLMKSNGMINYFFESAFHKLQIEYHYQNRKQLRSFSALTVDNVSGAFLVLGIGLSLSTILFLLEMYCFNFIF